MLAPLFVDANAPWRSALLIESPVNRYERPRNRYVGVRTATRKYVKYYGGFEEFFDVGVDPHELNNEAGNVSYAADLAALRGIQDTLKSCAEPSCWVP